MGYSAADVERYTYCPLSWHLARAGVNGNDPALRMGVEKHAEKGRGLGAVRAHLKMHQEAYRTAIHLALVAAAAATLAIEVSLLDVDPLANRALMLLSLLWLLTSLGFLVDAIRAQEAARRARVAANLVDGDVAYSDLDKPGAVLRSEKYGLGGRPDYIVRRPDGLIPVEVKSGKTPREPHESHVLQVASYCVLVEETYGQRPPCGIVEYEKAKFEVPYTDQLKDRVLETVLRMRLADVTGEVHRNHAIPARCRSCSRRAGCPERLE